jgi:uncharacterized Fe-S cluster-containing radical SAM superfamily protein
LEGSIIDNLAIKKYPRYLKPNMERFDPVELAAQTERIMSRQGNERKYTAFYATGVYGGIATGYTVGCCLRCYYCWVDWSRDFPEKYGEFYSAKAAYENLINTAKKFGVRKARISGAEPTLCKQHLLELLEYIEGSNLDVFILETNGVLFGKDSDYVRAISKFTIPHIRLCLKAGTSKGWAERTGATPESFELPYQGIKNLKDFGVSFHIAAMTDPRIMDNEERKILIRKVMEIDPRLALHIEEEIIDPYETTLARLKHAAVDLDWTIYKRF